MTDTDNSFFELKKHITSHMPLKLYEGELSIYKDCYIHWHKEFEIIYVVNGSTRVTINDKVVYGKTGDLIFIDKEALHFIQRVEEDKEVFQYKTLVYDLDFLRVDDENAIQEQIIGPLLDKKVAFENLINSESKNYESIKQNYLNLLTAYKSKNNYSSLKILSLIYELIYEMYDSGHVHHNAVNTNKNEHIIKCVMVYINKYYSENINIAKLATLVGFSECYFMHFFKKNIGQSVIDYINCYRINVAVDRLNNSNETIENIALSTGFCSSSYFIKKFKDKFGITPLQYRNKKKQDCDILR